MCGAGAQAGGVLAVDEVAHRVRPVFDSPVAAHVGGDIGGGGLIGCRASDAVEGLGLPDVCGGSRGGVKAKQHHPHAAVRGSSWPGGQHHTSTDIGHGRLEQRLTPEPPVRANVPRTDSPATVIAGRNPPAGRT